nr:RING finger protein 207 [Crassostrea gigas]
MVLSEPLAPADSVEGLPVIAQHYLECGNEDCERNAQFYCNPCHQPMCEQCRDEHQKSPKTKNHEVVLYRQRKRQLPKEMCSDHPNKDIDVLCEDCQVPLCSKCALKDHRKHSLIDLENFYSERSILCNDEIYKINQHFLPTSQDIQRDVLKDIKSIKATMDKIRKSMKAEAETFKSVVDTVMSENIEQANRMEELLMEELQSQDNTYKDYISYLGHLVKGFYRFLVFSKLHNNPIIFSPHDNLKVRPIPETTKPVPPVITAGQYSKEDVAKLLGRAIIPDAKPEYRKIKSMKTDSTELKQ